jgi:hypothetical protein
MSRIVVWFSCGAASAVAAKLAVKKYGTRCVVAYCDTSSSEHPDNLRFLKDVEKWIDTSILKVKNEDFEDIYDVFDKTGYLVGVGGARCTTELKKKVRREFEQPSDVHVFGYTHEEGTTIGQDGKTRCERFEGNNPELTVEWILVDNGLTKDDCLGLLWKQGIELPEMYKLGYRNNNCIGCVKGGQGYWNKIRVDFPEVFNKMATQERKMDVSINKVYINGKRTRLFLDEMPDDVGNYDGEPDISCGITCVTMESAL